MTKKSQNRIERDKAQEFPTVTLTYAQLAQPVLRDFLSKIRHSEVSFQTASRFRKLAKAVEPEITRMRESYIEEIQKKHEEMLKAAGLIVPGALPGVQAQTKEYTDEQKAKAKEINDWLFAQNDAFGKRTVEIELLPLAPQHLQEIKVSAEELEVLGDLVDEEGSARRAYFEKKLEAVSPEVPSA